MYGIIQQPMCGKNLGITGIALVDRQKSKSLWWTSDNPWIAMCYEKKSAAEFAAKRLRYNKARVVPFWQVKELLDSQSRAIREAETDRIHRQANYDSEDGWDGHKDSF